MAGLTENTVEQAALGWFESVGWRTARAADISPGAETPLRESHEAVVLEPRLRAALKKINDHLLGKRVGVQSWTTCGRCEQCSIPIKRIRCVFIRWTLRWFPLTGVTMSDNDSPSLSTTTFPVTVSGGSPVIVELIRGPSVGGDDHMALPGFELTLIPEPSTGLLLAMGLLGLAACRCPRRRRC